MRAQPSKSAKTIPTPAFVGVLDSGVGGLSVLREIHRLLPDTPTLYYADQAHLPYGTRTAAEICRFVEAIADFLIGQGAALIVLACHSASAAALEHLRKRYPEIPIVGIEPAVKPAAEATHSGVIGVLTTQATADGALYRRVVARYAAHVRVITGVSPELVTMVEQGSPDEALLRRCIEPMLAAGADQIVLACTHFPFLKAQIAQITDVTLVDPGAAVARQVRRVLPPSVHSQASINRYYTSGSPEQLHAMLKGLIGVDAEVDGGLKV